MSSLDNDASVVELVKVVVERFEGLAQVLDALAEQAGAATVAAHVTNDLVVLCRK